MSRYRLTERQYNQQVSDTHLERLSRSGCKQWKSLPPHLELETIVAEDIDKSQKGEREKRHEFLLAWKDMEGSGATYKQLITALLKIKCRQDAEKLCEMLKKSAQSELAIATTSATSHHAGKNARIYVECIRISLMSALTLWVEPDYITGIGNIIQAPECSVVRANTFSMGSCWAWQQLKMANF